MPRSPRIEYAGAVYHVMSRGMRGENIFIGPVFNNRFKSPLIQPDDPDYFRRVADYIHLIPARAKLLAKARPELKNYVWSSFPSIGYWIRESEAAMRENLCVGTMSEKRRSC